MRLQPALALATLVAACSGGNNPAVPGEPVPQGTAPDFHLQDVNPTSITAGELVSPRDQIGYVSAWYFGTAT